MRPTAISTSRLGRRPEKLTTWCRTVPPSVRYAVNNNLRVFAVATNLLDEQRFQMYGGSVIGRRILGGVTTTF